MAFVFGLLFRPWMLSWSYCDDSTPLLLKEPSWLCLRGLLVSFFYSLCNVCWRLAADLMPKSLDIKQLSWFELDFLVLISDLFLVFSYFAINASSYGSCFLILLIPEEKLLISLDNFAWGVWSSNAESSSEIIEFSCLDICGSISSNDSADSILTSNCFLSENFFASFNLFGSSLMQTVFLDLIEICFWKEAPDTGWSLSCPLS